MAYSPTSQLIREGALVLWHRYTDGTCYDWSGNGNVGTPSAGCSWEGGGLIPGAITDEVTVVDAASLQLTAFTLFFSGQFRSQTTTELLISKRSGASSNYFFRLTAGNMGLYDGTNVRERPCDVVGARSIAVINVHGGTPIGYVNGLSVGNFSGTLNVIANAHPVEIGNYNNLYPLRSPIHHALICNRILTATEIAAVHGELVR